ncbi:MAG: DUF3179 domain-containing protein [Nitrospirae bacterium]|nr:DUF3179 domain-containing protein [Nitrospirota bacterium]
MFPGPSRVPAVSFCCLAILGLSACGGGGAARPSAYHDGPFGSCAEDAASVGQGVPLPAVAFSALDKATGTVWDFWGRAAEGPPADQGARLRPYEQSITSHWFAWNTVWPTADLWSRSSDEEKRRRSADYFDTWAEDDYGTGLTLLVGKDHGGEGDGRVPADPDDPASGPLNPIFLGCFEERDCLPSLVAQDERDSLWVECRPREESRLCLKAEDPKSPAKCCDAEPCCDAVDLAPLKDEATLSTDQRASIESDMLRVKGWYLRDADEVIGAVVNGEPRAYPLKILWWHEVVNDFYIGQDGLRRRFAVTYSTLADAHTLLDSALSAEAALSFGVSGYLLNSTHILYDRLEENWWSPLRFQALRGPRRTPEPGLVSGCGVPAVRTTWGKWKEWFRTGDRETQARVLSAQTGFRRAYTRYPYRAADGVQDYRQTDRDTFRIGNPRPEHFADKEDAEGYVRNKEPVLGIVHPRGQKGYLPRDVRAQRKLLLAEPPPPAEEGQTASPPPEVVTKDVDGHPFSVRRSAEMVVINDEVGEDRIPIVIFWMPDSGWVRVYRAEVNGAGTTFEVKAPTQP